jgi:hypothetical protein
MPAIVPVNFRVVGSAIVFRTTGAGMLARACDGTIVAFEVDELDDSGCGGWSVLVVGVANLIEGSSELRALEAALVSAAGDDRDQFVSITIGELSGREVARDAPGRAEASGGGARRHRQQPGSGLWSRGSSAVRRPGWGFRLVPGPGLPPHR